jgi:tRNA pseudouridine32 synthase/23S rRNA pseudouridine746 synthase
MTAKPHSARPSSGNRPRSDEPTRSRYPEQPRGETARSPLADRVIFIDGEALVIDKPAGLPVDPPRSGALSIANHLSGLSFGFARWPIPVHRLDRDTSGCLLLARNPKAAARFTAAFEGRTVTKTYLAVLDGIPEGMEGSITLPIGKTSHADTGWRMVPDEKGKPSVTHWTLLAARDVGGRPRALIRMVPETGRTHQLRTHALHGLGIGILGDPVYRADHADDAWTGGLVLHARSLAMPREGKPPVAVTAPVPPLFATAGFPDAAALDGDPSAR